ncbi:hypothetical protein NQ041_22105 [Vibrio diabolicus]|uniref:hypothetical protein n=1 Tax=Vibrio diabolicus TaxID=50719 RepID=UPI00211C7DFE|nr:hypothetical protein [Vibrio diabolicus]MCQ9247873.1 hypothetical protein [Vibrio diabolicus]
MKRIEPINGKFVLTAPDGDWKFNEQDELVCDNPKTVYFESSAGEGKAKYWTDALEKAQVFTDIESAIAMREQTHRKHSPVSIMLLVTE